MSPTCDVKVHDQGSVVQFEVVSDAAKVWVAEHLEIEGWQWMGNRFAVDRRYVDPIVAMMEDQDDGPGLVIE